MKKQHCKYTTFFTNVPKIQAYLYMLLILCNVRCLYRTCIPVPPLVCHQQIPKHTNNDPSKRLTFFCLALRLSFLLSLSY